MDIRLLSTWDKQYNYKHSCICLLGTIWHISAYIILYYIINRPMGLPWSLSGKEPAWQCREMVWSLGGEDPLEKATAAHPSILLGKSQDRGASWATSLRGLKELDMTWQLKAKTTNSPVWSCMSHEKGVSWTKDYYQVYTILYTWCRVSSLKMCRGT